MAVLLGTAACQSVSAATGDSSSPDDTPATQRLDCEAEKAMLRKNAGKVLLGGGFERLPEDLQERVNPFTRHPCGSIFATGPNWVVFTSAHAGSNEHSAIRAVWSQVDAAWNARDAQAFSRLFAEDVSFTFVQRGQSLDGRTTILEHFGEGFPRYAPDLRHRTRIGAVQAIAPGVFAADGKVEILRVPDAGDEPPAVLRTFAIFAVMAVQDEDWSIRALRIYELSPSGDDAE